MSVSLNVNGDLPNSTKTFQIEGSTYVFHTYWNSRAGVVENDVQVGAWQVGLYLGEKNDSTNPDQNTLIIGGRQVMINQDMFGEYALENIFEGRVVCLDTTPSLETSEITLNNFGEGKRYQLFYFSAEELGLA